MTCSSQVRVTTAEPHPPASAGLPLQLSACHVPPASGGNNIRRLALEVAKEGYDLDTEWDSLRGSIISTTTGAAKVFSPTVGSGERPVPLLKPPTNPQVRH